MMGEEHIKELERRLHEIEMHMSQLKADLHTAKQRQAENDLELELQSNPQKSDRKAKKRPIRNVMLDALQDIGFLAYSRQIAIYGQARYGKEISSTRFGTISRDEEKAARAERTRTLWLCHGLSFERGEPIRRLWARSDWPLYERVVAPTTGRVLYLKATARFAELAILYESEAADSGMLKILAADNARDLGLQSFKRGEFPLEDWREKALSQLKALEEEDVEARKQVAEKLNQRLSGASLLFGMESGLVVLPGGIPGKSQAGDTDNVSIR